MSAFRKPRPVNGADGEAISTQLRQARNLINAGEYSGALSTLNTIASGTIDPLRQAQIVAMTGDCQFAQGDLEGALAAYQQAGTATSSDPRAWFRPALGQVRTLLAQLESDAAQSQANSIVQTAVSIEAAVAAQLAQASSQLASQGQVSVAARPIRPSVVATKLGNLFLEQGEIAAAQNLFQNALTIEPSGASQAQLGLARIALRNQDAAGALQHASDALTAGNFGARTVAAWPVLFAALRMANGSTPDASLLSGMLGAKATVAARAALMAARSMRASGNGNWQTLASAWLSASGSTNPTIAAELQKMLLASQRLAGTAPASLNEGAAGLMATANLAPSEFLAAAKEQVRAALALGQTPAFDSLVASGVSSYGAAFGPVVRHGLALACEGAGRSDLATALLLQNLSTVSAASPFWGRALWNLARLQKANGNYGQAANYLSQYLAAAAGSQRMQLSIQIEWARCVYLSGQPSLIEWAQSALNGMISSVGDYELALDTARQLTRAPAALQPLCAAFRAQGVSLAQQAFSAAATPGAAVEVLFKLARRQADFGDYAAILAGWTGLSDQTREWLWPAGTSFWSYLGFVFQAYQQTGNAGLEAFATGYLNDPATPATGMVQLGIRYALYKVNTGNFSTALVLFNSIASQSPTDPLSGYAWYWIALSQWKNGAQSGAVASGQQLLLAMGNSPTMGWQVDLSARGRVIVNGLVSPDSTNAAYTKALSTIQADLLRI